MNTIDLAGKTAVVTGAVGEIGKGIASRLLKSGARVWLWDLNAERLNEANSSMSGLGEVSWQQVDICDERSVAKGVSRIVEQSGRLDILVNNAGISGSFSLLEEYSLDEWRQVVDVNLTGAFVCCKAVIPVMRTGGYGRIVNVASIAGKEGTPRLSAYSAAKAGMVGMTKVLGKELASSPIIVNCVTPGPTRSRMTDETPPDQLAIMLSKVPMGRLMDPPEVGAAVAWLCSEDCSFTTGSVLDLSGGRSNY